MKQPIFSEEPIFLEAEGEWIGRRLDVAVAEAANVTRSAAARLIEEGCVTVNGTQAVKNAKLRAGDSVEINLPPPVSAEALPQDIPLDIVYEDADVAVINKEVGMVVHPAAGNADGTLVNALLWHCGESLSGVGGVIRPGIVHRIDKDTSGLLVVAKNDAAHLYLAEQLKEHRVSRVYYAVAIGNFKEDAGTVHAPIGRHPTDRKRMAILREPNAHARDAVTHWSVLARGNADGNAFTLLRCELETGRTHQIRVHMASLGHPLLGDPIYGGDRIPFVSKHKAYIAGQCLHAGELRFTHPTTKQEMHLRGKMPTELQAVIRIVFGQESLEMLSHINQ